MLEKNYLMKCNHVANARDTEGNPVCIICNCFDIAEKEEDLEGRMAVCSYCDNRKKSSYDLPFFKYRPNMETDEYYCGCFGWD